MLMPKISVCDRMTAPAITLGADTPYQEALKSMKEHRIRRIPIVDKKNKLIGIVSERDLLHAAPSPASSLNIWELNYLLSKLKLNDLMTKKVLTVTPETPVQEAATLMLTHKVGGLPVLDEGGCVIGVITETDIFRAFVELLNM
ncbi:MAG TPA: CBS domain-containing protein [Caldilineaceae bacterium]|nr:CBS domain-containing protein [Caldilineaceae bacterium]